MFATEEIARSDPYGLRPGSGREHDAVAFEHAGIDERLGVEQPPEYRGAAQLDGWKTTLELVLRREIRRRIVKRLPDEVHVEPPRSRDDRDGMPASGGDHDRLQDVVGIWWTALASSSEVIEGSW